MGFSLRQSTLSRWRNAPKLMNLTFRRSFVRIVSPVKGIFRRIPGLCLTENLPKLPRRVKDALHLFRHPFYYPQDVLFAHIGCSC